ncbi:MAG TPA: M20/M25/M40 family metallo-hydrolase [Armatimonadota bacterium]|nr:M20/M25/M40 family metallo-hydrolase [Armatimonadota bacterium]
MVQQSRDFMKQLIETPSVSGFEEPAQRVVARYAHEFGASVQADVSGNVLASIPGGNQPRVMLTGHVDQVGLMVRHINDEGFIFTTTVGGAIVQYAQRVAIHTRNGPVLGVVGKKPRQHMKPDEYDKPTPVHEYWIDIGATSAAQARETVSIGDPVTWHGPVEWLSDDLVCGCGIDDKIGVFIAIEALRRLKADGFGGPAAVSALSAVQEEVGCRGAGPAAFWAEPDAAIAVDVWPMVTDVPDTDKRLYGEMKLGAGPILIRGANISTVLFDLLVATAEEESIPIQFCGWPGPTPTDASSIYTARGGIATALIGLPQRYLHTPSEVVHMRDVEQIIELLVGVCRRMTPEVDFTRRTRLVG